MTEVSNLNELARSLVLQMMTRSLNESRPARLTQPQLEIALIGLQDTRIMMKKDRKARIQHTLISLDEYSAMHTGKDKARLLKDFTENPKEIYDPEAIKINPRYECSTIIESRLLMDLEIEYWNLLELRFTG